MSVGEVSRRRLDCAAGWLERWKKGKEGKEVRKNRPTMVTDLEAGVSSRKGTARTAVPSLRYSGPVRIALLHPHSPTLAELAGPNGLAR